MNVIGYKDILIAKRRTTANRIFAKDGKK